MIASPDAEYEKMLRSIVSAEFTRERPCFADLLRRTSGAYPSDVIRIARNCETEGVIQAGSLSSLLHKDSRPDEDGPIDATLSPPHPLDYEWRFSREGSARLLSEAARHGGTSIALLGASMLASQAAKQVGPNGLCVVDQGFATLDTMRSSVVGCKWLSLDLLTSDPPVIQAAVTIADPPWYRPQVDAFLWAASSCTAPNGHLLTVWPGQGTRPRVVEERDALFSLAESFGLHLLESKPQSVAYESPLFELNALRADGLDFVSRFWRKGDLHVFRRSPTPSPPRPVFATSTETWHEVRTHGCRIRVRDAGVPPYGRRPLPGVVSLVPGDVLPSVSRRDPRRNAVSVWTSGNRVFACDDTSGLLRVLRLAFQSANQGANLAALLGDETFVCEREAATRLVSWIHSLVRLEEQEYAACR